SPNRQRRANNRQNSEFAGPTSSSMRKALPGRALQTHIQGWKPSVTPMVEVFSGEEAHCGGLSRPVFEHAIGVEVVTPIRFTAAPLFIAIKVGWNEGINPSCLHFPSNANGLYHEAGDSL